MISGSGSGAGCSVRAAEIVANEITAMGGVAIANSDTVATRKGGRAIVSAALDTFGRLDIVISNAGILRTGRFDELADDDIDAVIDVHLKGAFYVGQPAFAAMKAQRYGRMLFTASSSGVFGHPWQASYGAAKAGILGVSNVVALEGKDFDVLSNVLMPNARTRLADQIDWRWTGEVPEVSRIMQRLGNPVTTHRLDPSWVTALAIFLVSDQSATTHGVFSAVMGRYARVLSGVIEGWVASGLPRAEDVAANWRQICEAVGLSEPLSVYDEAAQVAGALSRSAPGKQPVPETRL